uniref:Uncharacterized protein n=1 Tax=Trichobilharzia regenti TaxID=157069 RepID=A0AA85JV75_TRIRE|nr:unnamed protein product [Trichobilharzia regenti]
MKLYSIGRLQFYTYICICIFIFSYLRSRLRNDRMAWEQTTNLKQYSSNVFDCHMFSEPVHKSLTESLIKQLSINPADLHSYLVGSQLAVKIKREISNSSHYKKRNTPDLSNNDVSNSTKYKTKSKPQSTKASNISSYTGIVNSLSTNNYLIIKSANALRQSCSVSTRLNLNSIDPQDLESARIEDRVSVCLQIQGSPRKVVTPRNKSRGSLSENDILNIVSPTFSSRYKHSSARKSYENIIPVSRTSSIPSIPAGRIKGILKDELCIYGSQTGNTPRMSDDHDHSGTSGTQNQIISEDTKYSQSEILQKIPFRPKSASDAHKTVSLTEDMKGLLSVQPVHVQLKHFVSHEKKPSRVQSAREYTRRSIHNKYDSSTNLENAVHQSTDDNEGQTK